MPRKNKRIVMNIKDTLPTQIGLDTAINLLIVHRQRDLSASKKPNVIGNRTMMPTGRQQPAMRKP